MKNVTALLALFLLVSCGGSKKAATDTSTTATTTTNTSNLGSDYTTGTVSTNSSYSVTITASPSPAAALGATITLAAVVTGISDPSFDFTYVSGDTQNITASQNGNLATISSNVNNTLVIGVTVKSLSNINVQAYNQISLQFGSGSVSTTPTYTYTPATNYPTSTAATLTCAFGHSSLTPRVRETVYFFVSSNTGEPLRLVYWDPGEGWDNQAPNFPLSLSMTGNLNYFYGYYSSPGLKQVRFVAESVTRPGVFCNGGAPITDLVTVSY